jgi:hypothetical protein
MWILKRQNSATTPFDPELADLGGEHRAEPVPRGPDCFMTDIDAAFLQQILDIAKGQREANEHHHRQADNLTAGFEVLERGRVWSSGNTTKPPCPAQPSFV